MSNMKKKTRSISVKIETIGLLDEIKEIKIKEAMARGKLDIKALVKTKRGITYNKEINYLCKFYIEMIDQYYKSSEEDKKNCVIGKHLRRMGKMNSIA